MDFFFVVGFLDLVDALHRLLSDVPHGKRKVKIVKIHQYDRTGRVTDFGQNYAQRVFKVLFCFSLCSCVIRSLCGIMWQNFSKIQL